MVIRERSESGFAMVEVLAALVVLTVLAVGVVAGDRGGNDVLRRGLQETRAIALLQEQLDRARADPARIAIGAESFETEVLPEATVIRQVELVESGLLAIRVAVRWTAPEGLVTRELTTWVAREEGR